MIAITIIPAHLGFSEIRDTKSSCWTCPQYFSMAWK